MMPVIMDVRVPRRWARALSLSVGSFLFFALTGAVLAQGVPIPRDVDYGASGLVQFNYECETGSCSVRCFLHNTMVLEVKAAKSATFTSYRSHGRQNAPEKEVSVISSSAAPPMYLNFAGDGGCVFEAMRQTSATGFLARVSLDQKSKLPK